MIAPTALVLLALSAAPPRLAVMDVKVAAGASPQLAASLNDAVALEVRRQAPEFAVISSNEIRGLLAIEKQRQQLGCDTASCLAEIGGALGARQMITGSLARFGDVDVLTLKRIDAGKARVLRESSERFPASKESQLPDVVQRLVHLLFSAAETATGEQPPDLFSADDAPVAKSSHALGWTLIATSAACAVVAAVGWGFVDGYANEVNSVNGGNPNHLSAQGVYGGLAGANAWSGVAIGATALTALAVGGAVLTW